MGTRHADDPPMYFETHVFVCGNRRPAGHVRGDCAGKGAEKIRDYMKARVKELNIKGVRINQAGCLDRCELGPCAVLYPEGIWYQLDSFETADNILEQHIRRGKRVTKKLLPGDLPRLAGAGLRQADQCCGQAGAQDQPTGPAE